MKKSLFQFLVFLAALAAYQQDVMPGRAAAMAPSLLRDHSVAIANEWHEMFQDKAGMLTPPDKTAALPLPETSIVVQEQVTIVTMVDAPVLKAETALTSHLPDQQPKPAEKPIERQDRQTAPTETAAAPEGEVKDTTPATVNRKILFIGDSLAGNLFWGMRKKSRELDLQLVDGHRDSSGLANPAFHDWPHEAVKLVKERKPGVVVIVVGANDMGDIFENKSWLKNGSEGWQLSWQERLEKMISAIQKTGNYHIILADLPPMKSAQNEKRMSAQRKIIQDTAQKLKLPIALLSHKLSDNGDYIGQIKDDNGKVHTLRHTDGVHIAGKGLDVAADALLKVFPSHLQEKSAEAKDKT